MNTLLLIAILVLSALVLVSAGILFAICWVASGESDVNGDPEMDGNPDNEIERLSRDWDRGSWQSEHCPNLEYARRLNREALGRSSVLHTLTY